jgi:uncharacterized protein with GYD domain
MQFVSFFHVIPGEVTQAIKILKNPKIPPGLKIIESLWMFGKPEAVIIFEAPDEKCASEFVVQFAGVTEQSTSLVFPVDDLKWTL